MDEIEKCIDRIETKIFNLEQKEVESTVVGEIVMDELKVLDQVAYVPQNFTIHENSYSIFKYKQNYYIGCI